MRPAIGGEKAVLSPQSSVLRNAQEQCFCSQKLDLRHFSRECRENLNIRTCEHMILGQLRMGARQTNYAPLHSTSVKCLRIY